MAKHFGFEIEWKYDTNLGVIDKQISNEDVT
jgi:hypothetical protein